MTIKQLIVGTMIGASAFGSMLHRLPKPDVSDTKKPVSHVALARHHLKSESRLSRRSQHKHEAEAHLSLNKVFD